MAYWTHPDHRYYYDWDGRETEPPSDRDIKATLVQRLNEDPYTADASIRVDVRQHVVKLDGDVSSGLAKRVAGDDAWNTPGVVDVSNDLQVIG